MQVIGEIRIPHGWTIAANAPRDIDELCLQIHRFGRDGWAFRGEPSWYDSRKSSFGRRLNGNVETYARAECSLIAYFKHYAHSHLARSEETFVEDICSLLILMQHHGAPTRLLDWTRSVWNAAYFAASEGRDQPGFVWAFDHAALGSGRADEWKDAYMHFKACKTVDEYGRFLSTAPECAVCYNTVEATSRMLVQQSLYTWTNPPAADHLELLGRALPPECRKVLVIPPSFKKDLVQRLHQMNISAAALFPGLDGAGRQVGDVLRWGLRIPTMHGHESE